MTADTYWRDHGKSPSNTSIGNQMDGQDHGKSPSNTSIGNQMVARTN
jgi:hypothetical protein